LKVDLGAEKLQLSAKAEVAVEMGGRVRRDKLSEEEAPMARSNCSTFGQSNCSRQDVRIMRHQG
jgi:hypothetical protein